MLYYQNVRGLRTKTTMFYNNIRTITSDIVILTETFLNSTVNDAEIFPPEYCVLRKGRPGDVGVLLSAKNCYNIKRITNVDNLTDDK